MTTTSRKTVEYSPLASNLTSPQLRSTDADYSVIDKLMGGSTLRTASSSAQSAEHGQHRHSGFVIDYGVPEVDRWSLVREGRVSGYNRAGGNTSRRENIPR